MNETLSSEDSKNFSFLCDQKLDFLVDHSKQDLDFANSPPPRNKMVVVKSIAVGTSSAMQPSRGEQCIGKPYGTSVQHMTVFGSLSEVLQKVPFHALFELQLTFLTKLHSCILFAASVN